MYYDEFNEDDDINIGISNINDYKIKNNIKKFKVYFYFNLNEKNEYIFPFESDLLNIDNQYGYDLIQNIIKKINNESLVINYDSKDYILSVKENQNDDIKNFYINNFEIRKCKKKTFKPKDDVPPFSPELLLNNILDDTISFICKNNIYIILIEKFDDDIEEGKYEDDFAESEGQSENKNENQKIKDNNYQDDSKCKSCIII
jgi:hypothetical protein